MSTLNSARPLFFYTHLDIGIIEEVAQAVSVICSTILN